MAELVVNEKLDAIQFGLKERDGVWCLVKADGYKVALKFPWGDHQWSELLFVCPSVGLPLYLAQGP